MTQWAVPTCGLLAIGVSILALQNSSVLFDSTKECEVVVGFALVCCIVVGALNLPPLLKRKAWDVLVAYSAILVCILAVLVHVARQLLR